MVKGTFPFPTFSQCAHSAFPTRETLVKLQVFKLNHCEISSFLRAHMSCKRYFFRRFSISQSEIRHVSGNFTIVSSLLPW